MICVLICRTAWSYDIPGSVCNGEKICWLCNTKICNNYHHQVTSLKCGLSLFFLKPKQSVKSYAVEKKSRKSLGAIFESYRELVQVQMAVVIDERSHTRYCLSSCGEMF